MSDVEFERRVRCALRAPVPTSARAKAAIMEGVRRAAAESAPSPVFALPLSRGTRHSLIGVALAAGIGSVTTITTLAPSHGRVAVVEHASVSSMVIGDSVVDRVRDTLRLVRLMFDAPSARHVAIVGDFNGWRREGTPLVRDERTGRWGVTLALHDGAHRYAIVIDNTRRAIDPSSRSIGEDGQVHSLLRVARTAN